MAEESFQEKTEQATPKKRENAREEGQVARSAEIPSVLILILSAASIYVFGRWMYGEIKGVMVYTLQVEQFTDFNISGSMDLLYKVITRYLLILAPVMLVVVVAALGANFAQVGFFLSPKALEPKWDKLDVVKGFGRLFSLRSFMEMIKSVLKLTIIGLVVWFTLKGETQTLSRLYQQDVAAILIYILKTAFWIFVWVIVVMAVLAALDYAFQKWQFEKQIRMTKQEVKDEFKQTEGDPMVKSRIRSIQLQAARRRMMQAVPEADVVVTNPVHLAVAIRYDSKTMGAPKVVAKGASRVAERIKKMAAEHGIPIIENKELARNLYKTTDIDMEIPTAFYGAVAELLAYVYRLKGKSMG